MLLPNDVLGVIISFVSKQGKNWLNLRLVSKRFLAICRKIQNASHNKNWYLLQSIKNKKIDSIKSLILNEKVDPSIPNNYPFIWSCMFGLLEIVQLLIFDKRVDPGAFESRGLCDAIVFGHYDTVKLLLQDSRINPCIKDNRPIKYAYLYKHKEIIALLLQNERVYKLK